VNADLQRAILLYQQSRHELAEEALRRALAVEPDESYAHALLALCLVAREQFKEATGEAQRSVHLAPDTPFPHYALAKVLFDRDHLDEAVAAIEESIRLDPEDADYYSLLAAIRFNQRRWQEALAAAEQGLQCEPEHVSCTNLRAMALVKLGRKQEAGATIDVALARNPDNAVTHANQGWTLIEKGDYPKALEHFREALRLDPQSEWARHGIIEALKAKNVIYAVVLKYFLWMSRLSRNAQWGVVIGGVIGNRMLGAVSASNPELAPWLLPIRLTYVAFVFLTWCADPLFNLLLRLNQFGRLVLSPEQILASNLVGACVLVALLSLVAWLLAGFNTPWILGVLLAFLVIPVSSTFKAQPGWPRKMLAALSIVMAVLGVAMVAASFAASSGGWQGNSWKPLSEILLVLYGVCIIASPWVANFLLMQRPKR